MQDKLTAEEILEWIKANYNNNYVLYHMFGEKLSIYEMLMKIPTETIVKKINEYEKQKRKPAEEKFEWFKICEIFKTPIFADGAYIVVNTLKLEKNKDEKEQAEQFLEETVGLFHDDREAYKYIAVITDCCRKVVK